MSLRFQGSSCRSGGFRRWVVDLVSGRAVISAVIIGLFMVIEYGSEAQASQTWLSCQGQTVDQNGQVAADQQPNVYVYDSRGLFYLYCQTDTKKFLNRYLPENKQYQAGLVNSTLQISDDEIQWTRTQSNEPGSPGDRNVEMISINRVNMTYHELDAFFYPDRGPISNTTDGTCTIIPPQPLGLTAKQQF